jgi:hypothetical protein
MAGGVNHALLMLVPPSIVPKMNVKAIVPSVIVEMVLPLESPNGLPFEHGIHTNHPLHHTTFVHFALIMLLLFEVICFVLI